MDFVRLEREDRRVSNTSVVIVGGLVLGGGGDHNFLFFLNDPHIVTKLVLNFVCLLFS